MTVNAYHDLFWGLGIGIEELPGEVVFLHGGSNPGYRNFFWYVPGHGRGLLFLSNGENGYALVRPFVHLLLPGDHPALTAPQLHLP